MENERTTPLDLLFESTQIMDLLHREQMCPERGHELQADAAIWALQSIALSLVDIKGVLDRRPVDLAQSPQSGSAVSKTGQDETSSPTQMSPNLSTPPAAGI